MGRYVKYVLAITFFCIATSVLANGLYDLKLIPTKPYFAGPYLGIGIGAVDAHADVTSESSNKYSVPLFPPPLRFSLTTVYDLDKAKYGFDANIFAGYGIVLNQSIRLFYLDYLGVELFGHYFSPTLKGYYHQTGSITIFYNQFDFLTNLTTKIENPFSFGGDIRIGYLVSPRFMMYVLFGMDYAQFKVKNKSIVSIIDAPIDVPDETTINSFNKWKLGYIPGIGIETGLSNRVSLRIQYTYTFYPSFNHTATSSDAGDSWTYKGDLKTKVNSHRNLLTVMLSYFFN